MIEGRVGIADFAMSLTIELVLLARFHKSSTVLSVHSRKNSTKSIDSGQKLLRRYFGVKKAPENTALSSLGRLFRTSLQVTQVKSVVFHVLRNG